MFRSIHRHLHKSYFYIFSTVSLSSLYYTRHAYKSHRNPTTHSLLFPSIYGAPTFNGIPTPTTLLISQSLSLFSSQFPDLEISPIYLSDHPDYTYSESGFFFPSSCTVIVPLFQKLDMEEEKKLGANGIRKEKVGFLEMKGRCETGCAKVTLTDLKVKKLDGSVVWEWTSE